MEAVEPLVPGGPAGRAAGGAPTVRTFVAVELEAALRHRLSQAVQRLRPRLERALGPVRWVGEEQFHITLRFLGELPVERVARVAEALERACQQVSPFRLQLQGLGAFPALHQVRVIWVGVDEEAARHLTGLARQLEEELEREGFGRSASAFVPHLTLGRLRQPARWETAAWQAALAELAPERLGFSEVQEAVVMRSELRPTGARYSALHRCRLGGADAGGRAGKGSGQP